MGKYISSLGKEVRDLPDGGEVSRRAERLPVDASLRSSSAAVERCEAVRRADVFSLCQKLGDGEDKGGRCGGVEGGCSGVVGVASIALVEYEFAIACEGVICSSFGLPSDTGAKFTDDGGLEPCEGVSSVSDASPSEGSDELEGSCEVVASAEGSSSCAANSSSSFSGGAMSTNDTARECVRGDGETVSPSSTTASTVGESSEPERWRRKEAVVECTVVVKSQDSMERIVW